MSREPDTEQLLDRAARGDSSATEQLLDRHRERLLRMVTVRLDRRLSARVDPSDIVQETLGQAARKLSTYLRKRDLAFYPWLRQIAADHLTQTHRHHIQTQARSIHREEPWVTELPDESVVNLARKLVARSTSPSGWVIRREQQENVRAALAALPPRDREILVMLYLEQLTSPQIAEVLGVTSDSIRMRHMRALRRIRDLLGCES